MFKYKLNRVGQNQTVALLIASNKPQDAWCLRKEINRKREVLLEFEKEWGEEFKRWKGWIIPVEERNGDEQTVPKSAV